MFSNATDKALSHTVRRTVLLWATDWCEWRKVTSVTYHSVIFIEGILPEGLCNLWSHYIHVQSIIVGVKTWFNNELFASTHVFFILRPLLEVFISAEALYFVEDWRTRKNSIAASVTILNCFLCLWRQLCVLDSSMILLSLLLIKT